MADEGATPRELLLEASRRNNTALLTDILSQMPSPPVLAHFLNTTTDGLGSSALHIAAQYGSYEILDLLLDQEGLEIDHTEPREGDTALHKAVRWVNSLDKGDWEAGGAVVEILIDAGCDPRIRNKAKLRPVELVDPRNEGLRDVLRKAEFMITEGAGLVEEEEGGDGPASDSD